MAGGKGELWIQPVVGGSREVLWKGTEPVRVSDWSRDGKIIFFGVQPAATGQDIEYVRLDGDRQPASFLRTGADEVMPSVSPNQRWFAFLSDEDGSVALYVNSFPSGERKWRISNSDQSQPRWSADGRTLYYLSQGSIQAVDVRDEQSFVTGRARTVSALGNHVAEFDDTSDGRIVALRTLNDTPPPLKVVLNWRELVPDQ